METMKTIEYKTIAIVIPAYEPDQRLFEYVQKLSDACFGYIVIVDDGSSSKNQAFFNSCEKIHNVTVIHHSVNQGKGIALKTAYQYILDQIPDVEGIITVDADGQHTIKDCLRVADSLVSNQHILYLGGRDFSLPCVPEKSRKGNRITSSVFKTLYGQYLQDTQTGLRAFRSEDLPFMISIKGDRYEYEMNVLIACRRSGIKIETIPIETIYENNNEGTHFHPIRDSWKIYKVIFGGLIHSPMDHSKTDVLKSSKTE